MRLDKLEVTQSFTAAIRRDAGDSEGMLPVPPAVAETLPDGELQVSVGVPVPVAMPPEPPERVSPVEPGEIRLVTITDRGRRGDGIALVERGFVVIVPGTAPDDRVLIEIEEVRDSYALARTDDSGHSPK
jgi:predicted RNA-binding protein with TRAM domain